MRRALAAMKRRVNGMPDLRCRRRAGEASAITAKLTTRDGLAQIAIAHQGVNVMKACPQHRHEHRQLPCPWPDCVNSEGAGDVFEVPRHTGAGKMTRSEGHFDVSPPPRRFDRKQWSCDLCGATGWGWVEVGAERRMDRCPHRLAAKVTPRARS